MKKFVMTDEKRHDLRELKITVIILISAALLLGMLNWACYLVDSTYAKQLPLGEYLVYYSPKNLSRYKETLKEFSVPTLNDITRVEDEKQITDRYNYNISSAMRVYRFEYGTELDDNNEVFFTKYLSDTGVYGYFGVVGRTALEFNDYGIYDYENSYVNGLVLMPDVDVTAEALYTAVERSGKAASDIITGIIRPFIGIGLPQVSGKEGATYVCIVLSDGVLELTFNESGNLTSKKLFCGDYSKSSVSKNLGKLVDLRNEAFAK